MARQRHRRRTRSRQSLAISAPIRRARLRIVPRNRGFETSRTAEADIHLLRFAEHLLASAIGTASSRLVLSLMLRRRNVSREAALRLVDDASSMLKYNRDLLQHALDFARQGITVFDRDLG